MAVDEQNFKNALKLWASGITVVTSNTDGMGLKGMTATSFSSVSATPPLILVCLNQSTDTGAAILEGKSFAVNILSSEQETVSNQFAGSASQEERFSQISWHKGNNSSPILDDALASMECKLVNSVEAGSHWIIVGEVEQVICRSGEPLLYFNSNYCNLKN